MHGFIDTCKTNVRVSLVLANFKTALLCTVAQASGRRAKEAL
jgi:hypothetical protein